MKTSSEINIEFKVDNKLDKGKKPPNPLDKDEKGISDNLEKEGNNNIIKDRKPEKKQKKRMKMKKQKVKRLKI